MSRPAVVTLLAACAVLAGGTCGGGSGSGGESVRKAERIDSRCASLGSFFPPGLDVVPGRPGIVWAVDFSPPTLLPFDFGVEPPAIVDVSQVYPLPVDSDGDGVPEGLVSRPVPDDFEVVAADLGLLTTSDFESVLFFDPTLGKPRSFDVSTPASFLPIQFPRLPAPGAHQVRRGVSTLACVAPPADALDSRGARLADVLPAAALCNGRPSYFTAFTSGAAIAGGRLWVTQSNLGEGAGTQNTQYLPGTLLAFDVDLAASPPRIAPNPDTPVVFTRGFNPTHVTAVRRGAREFALVTVSGAIGLALDDPNTPVLEGGGTALTDGAIEVVDAQSLELVAYYPLGQTALSFDRLAIDPTGRVAVTGSAVSRRLYAVDLAALDGVPSSVSDPVRLDAGVIFDVARPLVLPGIPGGAPPERCPGFTVSVAWNAAGNTVYAADFCDGTLGVVRADLGGNPPVPVDRARFSVQEPKAILHPLRSDTNGMPRAPGSLVVRPGRPGTDFTGPDVFTLVGQPGQVCGFEIESQ